MVIHRVSEARVLGIQWRYPESIVVSGICPRFGGAMAIFDENAALLPAMKVLGRAVR